MTHPSKKLLVFGALFFIVLLILVLSGLAVAQAPDTVEQVTSPAAKSVYGVVSTSDGQPVGDALLTARRIDAPDQATASTVSDGAYQLGLGPGLWAITLEPAMVSTPGDWLSADEPQQVDFRDDGQVERVELNFSVVAADAAVKGRVTMPDGSLPPFRVTIGLYNGEGFGRRVDADPATGEFKMAVPQGRYDIVVHPYHDRYLGPQLEPLILRPGQTLDLGAIALIPLDATILGKVVDEEGNGVAGMPVTAWQRDRFAALSTRTNPDGFYRLAVGEGLWHVQPSPGPDSRYLYLGQGETVKIGSGETISGVDFEVLAAGATIVGILVAPADVQAIALEGWATAVSTTDPAIQNGAPIRAGRFAIHVPGGGYLVSAELAPGSPYLSTAGIAAEVRPGQTVTITIPLRREDAVIAGALIDPRQDHNPVTGVRGVVSGWSDHNWSTAFIRPDTGTYSLDVAAGVWRVNYRISSQEYVKIGGPANIPVESGQTVHWPLLVTRKDAGIAGQVLAPDGRPLPGAVVIVDGLIGEVSGLWLRTRTDREGWFKLSLPYGRYRVGAAGGETGWINPLDWTVSVAPGSVVDDIKLQFQKPDAEIQGMLTVLNTSAEGDVLVWAWTERGGFTRGRFPVAQLSTDPGGRARGPYHLNVISGALWHLGAVFETDDAYWLGQADVKVTGPSTTLDLMLNGPFPKPPPLAVTFDAGQAQRLELADGTSIFIPPGAMPVEGMVTLRIIPIASLPHQRGAHIVRYGYAFFATDASGRPIEEQFNHDVLIRFKYDAPDFASLAPRIRPAYFSTTTNSWTFPERYVVNPHRHIVIMAIDHFTNFALVETAGLEIPVRSVNFLPHIANGCAVTVTPAAEVMPAAEATPVAGITPCAQVAPPPAGQEGS
jgi:hypothetical protein